MAGITFDLFISSFDTCIFSVMHQDILKPGWKQCRAPPGRASNNPTTIASFSF